MTSLSEQETIVNMIGDDPVVHVWSNIPAHVRRMRKLDAYREVYLKDSTDTSGFFEIDKADYRPLAVKPKRVLTDEQREALAERGRKLAASRSHLRSSQG